MKLTTDDLQAIGKAVRPIVKEEVHALRTEIQEGFENQSKSRERHFADLKVVMETNYVNRTEFEDKYNELQNEVDELRERLKKLEASVSTP